MEELEILDSIPHYVPCSAHLEWNLDDLIEKIWEYLDLIRIYTKPKVKICSFINIIAFIINIFLYYYREQCLIIMNL